MPPTSGPQITGCVCALASLILGQVVTARSAVAAEEPLRVERYEVKLNLRSERALEPATGSSTGRPVEALQEALGVDRAKPPERATIRFYDDCGKGLLARGWSVRLREKAGERELSYKKRYPMQKVEEPEPSLGLASGDGFATFPLPGYKGKAEVDWATEKQALSLTLEPDAALPGDSDLRAFAIAQAPSPMLRDSASKKALEASAAYGPVEAQAWTGEWPGKDEEVDIEVWRVGGRDIVEVSFKEKVGGGSREKARKDAAKKRKELAKLLDKWVNPDDSFKTDAVLNAHRPASCPSAPR
jgi:hypothetical protein